VSKYSKKPFIAAKVVEFLSGEYVQKQRALNFGLLPTIKSLYYGNIYKFFFFYSLNHNVKNFLKI